MAALPAAKSSSCRCAPSSGRCACARHRGALRSQRERPWMASFSTSTLHAGQCTQCQGGFLGFFTVFRARGLTWAKRVRMILLLLTCLDHEAVRQYTMSEHKCAKRSSAILMKESSGGLARFWQVWWRHACAPAALQVDLLHDQRLLPCLGRRLLGRLSVALEGAAILRYNRRRAAGQHQAAALQQRPPLAAAWDAGRPVRQGLQAAARRASVMRYNPHQSIEQCTSWAGPGRCQRWPGPLSTAIPCTGHAARWGKVGSPPAAPVSNHSLH